ncbi:glycosyltransferase involved in cell wall biosynthesis [Aliiruegeria haliotis]|uniref:Glycosyltransferase involved in cell wall biosynthesis n=1 Tax=Aliiruegeria haliotis TaxID=1280846 RepID=A0A2T0RR05_9RHOB|nr:glycosyltransferase family 4 protein [Aliiruegeria haliotis]PRY23624.1 glycosyltransferase involved in cell wall biosynthesis [Aliiruegeria haliotis]
MPPDVPSRPGPGADNNGATLLKVLLLADDCNPEWPSLPIVGFKYACALARHANVTVATHVRNRENIEKHAPPGLRFRYIDNEYIARPLYRLGTWLRGGDEVAWSTGMIMSYPSYLAFEREVRKVFRTEFAEGAYDIVHRITPMSPTMPSAIVGRTGTPFVIGPLNGNLDWPAAFRGEQKRERERLRALRGAHKWLPYARRTFARADLILAGFDHTARDIAPRNRSKLVNFPEIGFDAQIFHADGRARAFSGPGPHRFLFVGRLVPYKLPEVAIRAFMDSEILAPHHLHIVGDGPEYSRLRDIAAGTRNADRIHFEGHTTQAGVADRMRDCDAFVFPSIRELGAGAVIEAMASAMTCIVADYGAPGHLAAHGRGHRLPISGLSEMVDACRARMEQCVLDPEPQTVVAEKAHRYAVSGFTWDQKAKVTLGYYRDLIEMQPIRDRGDFD